MNIIIIFLIPTAVKPVFLQGITVITHLPKVPEFTTQPTLLPWERPGVFLTAR